MRDSNLPALSPAWREAIAFGVLWGSVEITLGAFLHAVRFPMTGVCLSIAATAILVSGRSVFPRPGFCVRAGLICIGIKCFGPGGLKLGILVALLAEALLIELAYRLPSPKAAAALSGVLTVAWSLCQPVINYLIFYGGDIVRLLVRILETLVKWSGVSSQTGIVIGGLFLLMLLLLGAAGGILGLSIGNRASVRYWTEEPQ